MLIRPTTPDDVAAMQALSADAATAARWSAGEYARLFDPEAPRRPSYVLEEDGAVQGFIVIRAVQHEWELENMAVAAPARRRGWGSRLLSHALDHMQAAGATYIYLEVRESNQAARALYERWGFQECGRRRGYYAAPREDAVLYQFSFSSLHRK